MQGFQNTGEAGGGVDEEGRGGQRDNLHLCWDCKETKRKLKEW